MNEVYKLVIGTTIRKKLIIKCKNINPLHPSYRKNFILKEIDQTLLLERIDSMIVLYEVSDLLVTDGRLSTVYIRFTQISEISSIL